MLLQTNSYIVPKEKRAEHARLMRRFRQVLNRLGCDNFEVYEQVGANWSNTQSNGRFVQMMRFRDRKHQLAVQNAEREDPTAQAIIAEFCQLVNYPYQVQQNWFAVGFYSSVLPVAPVRVRHEVSESMTPLEEGEAEELHEAEPGQLPSGEQTHPPVHSEPPANGQSVQSSEPDIELDDSIFTSIEDESASEPDASTDSPRPENDRPA